MFTGIKKYGKRGLFCLFAGFGFSQISAQEIKILTYNIYHGEQGYDKGKSNLEDIAAIIKQYKPDFVALQEVDSMTDRTARFNNGTRKDLVKELAALTGMYGYYGKAMDYSNGGYGEGLLSRYADTSAVYHLPIPKGGEPRAMIAIRHTFPNGRQIVFGATHLCHEYEENRMAQVKEIAATLAAKKVPAILAGDLNITPDTQPYQYLTTVYKDAAELHGKPELTFPSDKPTVRLDYVFLSKENKWKVKEVKVIDAKASDHKPVLVILELKD
ncbi:endonuclease [Pseudoflavitalea sp. G-6-1-2]|nr:endonuclease [Pseudoflavitalea sp. G-6-1-2]